MTATAPPPLPPPLRPLHPEGRRPPQPRRRQRATSRDGGWTAACPSDEFVAYLEERAKGGVGLFVIGATSPERGLRLDGEPGRRASSRATARWSRRATGTGRPSSRSLCHPGFKPLPGTPIIARAPPAEDDRPRPPRVAPLRTDPRAHPRLVAAFGAAAGRAARGGVDGVELHSHESFLHAQFLNPLWNTRTDEYGGCLENRMRFMIETLEAMRAAIGTDMPLGVRLKLDDVAQRGMDLEEYLEGRAGTGGARAGRLPQRHRRRRALSPRPDAAA